MTTTTNNTDTNTGVQALAERLGVPWSEVEKHSREMDRVLNGVALQDLRKAQKVTQRELAKRIGVSQNRISKIEKGQFDKTQIGTVQKYIEALGGQITLDATFGDTVVPLHLG
jgi:DNA-binding XRE family transcriptional regulator